MCAHARIQDSYCISLDPENVSTLTQYLIHLLHQTRAAIYLPIKYFRIFQRWLLGVSIPQQRFSFSSAICSFFEALLSLSLSRTRVRLPSQVATDRRPGRRTNNSGVSPAPASSFIIHTSPSPSASRPGREQGTHPHIHVHIWEGRNVSTRSAWTLSIVLLASS